MNISCNINNNTRPLVMFGLGVNFHDCYQQLVTVLGRTPDFVCDNASEKWGKEFYGIQCISPAELCKLPDITIIVITIRRYEQIHQQLKQLGLKNILLACFDRGYEVVSSIKSLENEQQIFECENFESPVKGKWTFITGASRGIGRQITLNMAKLGSNIIAHSRQIENTREIIETCTRLGVKAIPINAELSNLDETKQMLDNLENKFPSIDIVFNNAGISLPCGPDPMNISSQDYLTQYIVNTISPIQICYRLIPGMVKRGYGRIINVSSTIQKNLSGAAYACSKAALNKFVFDIAPSLRGTGVMISLTCPGFVKTDMGGKDATHNVESVIPGVLLGALMDSDVNGRWFIAQDYAGLSIPAAIRRAKFYYSYKELINV